MNEWLPCAFVCLWNHLISKFNVEASKPIKLADSFAFDNCTIKVTCSCSELVKEILLFSGCRLTVAVAEREGKNVLIWGKKKDKKEPRFTTFCNWNPVRCRAPLAKPLKAWKQHKTHFKLYVWQNDKNRHNTPQDVHIPYHLWKSHLKIFLNFSEKISSKLSVNSIMQKTFSWKFHISFSLVHSCIHILESIQNPFAPSN